MRNFHLYIAFGTSWLWVSLDLGLSRQWVHYTVRLILIASVVCCDKEMIMWKFFPLLSLTYYCSNTCCYCYYY